MPATMNAKLTPKQQSIIEAAQQSLLESPVDITQLAKTFGIARIHEKKLGERMSGKIERLDDDKYHITVNKAEGWVRQRFTIAHELAHYLLHREQIGDGITENVMYRGGLSTQEEVEANRLAAEILMPLDRVDQYIKTVKSEKGKVQIGWLAEAFGVSVSAMQVRLGIPSEIF